MSTWGVVPAAGLGTRIQPLAFSKELLPVGTRRDGETEGPRAVLPSPHHVEYRRAGVLSRKPEAECEFPARLPAPRPTCSCCDLQQAKQFSAAMVRRVFRQHTL